MATWKDYLKKPAVEKSCCDLVSLTILVLAFSFVGLSAYTKGYQRGAKDYASE